MKQKLILSLCIGILLSSATLYLAFRNVPFADLIAYLETINYLWVLPAVFFIIIGFVLRALRWQIILNTSEQVSFRQSYHPLMIGFMLNCIFPGRVGEAARPLILNRKEGVPFAAGLATVATERLLDAAFLICLLVVALSSIPTDTVMTIGKYHLNRETLEVLGINLIKICFLLLAGILFVTFDKTRNVLKKCIEKLPDMVLFFASVSLRNRVRKSFSSQMIRLLDHAATGLSLLKHPWRIGMCMGITILIWCLTVVSYYAMAMGCPGVELTFYEFTIVMVIICFFIALPSVPGFWGVWEAGGVFALSLFGVTSQTAAGFTLANHAVQLFPVIIMGLISAAAVSVNIWQVSYGERIREQ